MANEHHGGENQSGSRLVGTHGSNQEQVRTAKAASAVGAGAEGKNPPAAPLSKSAEGAIEADWWDDSEESSARVARARRAALPSAVPPRAAVATAAQPTADASPPEAPTASPHSSRAGLSGSSLGRPYPAPPCADRWDDGDEPAAPRGGRLASPSALTIVSTPAIASAPAAAAPHMRGLATPSAKVGAATSSIPQALAPAPVFPPGPRSGAARGRLPSARAAARVAPPILAKLPHASKADYFPAIFCRSALFRVGGTDEDPDLFLGTPAAAAGPIPIEAQGGANLTLEGPWPRMRDKAVWEAAIAIAKERPNAFGAIPVNLSDFAKRLGIGDKGGRALGWIWTSLRRLALCRIEFDPPAPNGARIAGHLLLAARQVGKRREIQLDPALATRLLEEDYQFRIDAARRRKLSSALARWLHDFLSTHSNYARPFDLPYLRGLCGHTAAPRRFPAELRRALGEVAQKAPELLASFSISPDSKSSCDWTVALTLGSEPRRFEKPKVAAPKPPPCSQSGPSKSRRGGVAL